MIKGASRDTAPTVDSVNYAHDLSLNFVAVATVSCKVFVLGGYTVFFGLLSQSW